MSELPSGWTETTIDDICQVNPRPTQVLTEADAVSFVPMAAVEQESGRLDSSETRTLAEIRAKSYRPFQDGDVLVAKITPCMENGKMAIAEGLVGGFGFGSTEFHVLRPEGGINARYVLWYVMQKRFRAEAARNMTGTAGQLRVPVGFLKSTRIPLPPTAEQQRIVSAIEEQFSRLDASDACLLMAQRRLRTLRSAAVQRALGDGWKTVELGEVTERQEYGSSAKATALSEGGVPIIAMGNIQGGELVFDRLKFLPADHDDVDRYRLSPGDVLFNRTNSPELVGKSAVYREGSPEALFASYLIRVRLEPVCDPEWAALVMNSPAGRRYIAAVRTQQVGQANVNGSKLKRFPIPLPPLSEQRLRLEELDQLTTVAKAVGAAIDLAKRRSGTLRQALLGAAFSGTLLPQNPTDEPADALIQRIVTERDASPVGRPTRKRSKVEAI